MKEKNNRPHWRSHLRSISSSPLVSPALIWEKVIEKQGKATQTQGEHANFTQKGTNPRDWTPITASPFFLLIIYLFLQHYSTASRTVVAMSGFSFVLLLSAGFLLSFLLRIASFGQFCRPAPQFAQGLACVIHVELPVLFNLTWKPSQFVTDKQKEKKKCSTQINKQA